MSLSLRAVVALVLALLAATACSTTVGRDDVAARASSEAAAAEAEAAAEASAEAEAAERAAAEPGTDFGSPHTFPDGSVVTVSEPRDGGAAPAAARTVVVTVGLRNGGPAPVNVSQFDVAGTADGAEVDALDDAAQPDVDLLPGATTRFDLRFPVPPAPAEFALTTTMTRVDAAGNDVPGSDTAPGASVTFEDQV